MTELRSGVPRHSALALALWPDVLTGSLRSVLLVVIGSLLLALSAQVQVPFYPVPMTLQTFAVLALGAAYGLRLAVITVLAYLAEAAIGLPFLAGGAGGAIHFVGPTAGYLWGFIPAAAIAGFAADRGWDRQPVRLGAAMLIADTVVFALGFAWLAWFAVLPDGAAGIGPAKAFAGGVAPFLLGDLLKVALAACPIPAAWQLIRAKSNSGKPGA